MFIAFKPAQNLISRLFHNLGYEFLGKISLISLYLLFGLFSIITPRMITRFKLKYLIILSCALYGPFDLNVFVL